MFTSRYTLWYQLKGEFSLVGNQHMSWALCSLTFRGDVVLTMPSLVHPWSFDNMALDVGIFFVHLSIIKLMPNKSLANISTFVTGPGCLRLVSSHSFTDGPRVGNALMSSFRFITDSSEPSRWWK